MEVFNQIRTLCITYSTPVIPPNIVLAKIIIPQNKLKEEKKETKDINTQIIKEK